MPDPDPNPNPTPPPDPDPAPDRTFTQADVDRIVQERLSRAKTTPPDDYADLKAKAAKLAEIEAANQTELEKAQKRADEAEQTAKAATARATETALRAAIVSEAAKQNAVDPDAAFALIDRSTLTVADDGTIPNIADAMKALLAAKPYLVGGSTASGADQGARPGKPLTADQIGKLSDEEFEKSLASGDFATALGSK